MKVQCLSSDRISNLPPNILEMILTHLPLRDALRTSILSKKWRYSRVNIPKLVFDDKLFEASDWSNKYKVLFIICQVLLLHQGPILDFTLSTDLQVERFDIDPIVLHLSRSNTVQNFSLSAGCWDGYYKLPASFFSLKRLTHLCLLGCAFQPPSTFNGFSVLTSLYLYEVVITAKALQLVISNSPLLKSFTLICHDEELTGEEEYNFIEVLGCSAIEYVFVNKITIQFFAAGWLSQKRAAFILQLKILNLSDLSFREQDDLSSALFLIHSSPNLKRIEFKLNPDKYEDGPENPIALPELPDGFSLDHLEELEMKHFTNLMSELEFVKLVLANSSMLKKVVIKHLLPVDEEVKMLKELLQLPRASPVVKFDI